MPELSFVHFEFRKLNNKRALNFRISVCKENYFKKDRGTHACIPCPKNTVSEKSGASCKCKERHYSENGLCKGKILSMVLASLNCLLHLDIIAHVKVAHLVGKICSQQAYSELANKL